MSEELIVDRDLMERLFEIIVGLGYHEELEIDQLLSATPPIKAGQGEAAALAVWYGSMPESNGKSNYTAILHRKGECISEGITLDRSEYPDRVRYEADRVRFLIGELNEKPFILDYDADKQSDYTAPPATGVNVPRELLGHFIERYDAHAMIRATMSRIEELRALLAQSQEVR